jgi:alkylation response protein AidB-like acyl-CoA dehydrogenase
MDFSFTPEQLAFQERFDRVCRERVAPHAAAADRAGAVSAESWRALVDAGYLRLFHPAAHGGTDADGVTLGIAMESVARSCAGTFWAASISSLLCGQLLRALCAPEHHRRWLAPIVAGERLGCFAATEDAAGSDPGSYRTTLHRTAGRGLRLEGAKSRISNACTADVAVVLARDGEPTGSKLCYVVVDLRRPGIRRAEQPKLGLLAMSWGSIHFEDLEIPPEDVIAGADIEKTLQVVEWGQLLQAWCAIGIAASALEAALHHAGRRHAFGRPIGHLEVVHGRLADMRADLDAARLLALDATWCKGAGRPARDAVLMAKIYATEMAVRVADQAMRTFGGWGFSKDHAVERLYRDSLANVPAGLPNDRLRELLACEMVGVSPWAYEPFDGLASAGLRLGG